MISSRYTLIVASILLSSWQFGCDSKDEEVTSKRSGVKVQLPDKPELKKPSYKRVHGDGVLTVEGLLRERDAHLNRQVTVRGKVDMVKLCDAVQEEAPGITAKPADKIRREKARKKTGNEPVVVETITTWKCKPQPYAILVDSEGSQRHRLRVGGTMGSRLASLKVGEMVDLNGTFDVVSPNRKYMDQQGVLFLQDLGQPATPVVGPGN
tara:strand:- start:912 stop:1538 length:627 start_codon:yes stop_codon:yes gene_type:complete